jgi:hypothetical protein
MRLSPGLPMLFSAKPEVGLSPLPDPRQALELICRQQQALLHQVRRGLIDVAIARQELRHQVHNLYAQVALLPTSDQRACLAELSALDSQLTGMAEQEQSLTLIERQMARRVDCLRAAQSQLSACYAPVEDQDNVSPGSPPDDEWSPLLEQTRARTEGLRSRTAALNLRIYGRLAGTPQFASPGMGRARCEVK